MFFDRNIPGSYFYFITVTTGVNDFCYFGGIYILPILGKLRRRARAPFCQMSCPAAVSFHGPWSIPPFPRCSVPSLFAEMGDMRGREVGGK